MAEKKVRDAGLTREELRGWIEPNHESPAVARQCELIGLPRSTAYHRPRGESAENLSLMRRIDEAYTERPCLGSHKLSVLLGANRKRVQRLMRLMGIEGVRPRRCTTRPRAGHRVYPYLLRNRVIGRPDEVWASDITYVPMRQGFLYLVAVMDWFSRHVLSWRLSNTLEGTFCVEALESALSVSRPAIFNSDQGSQFTAVRFTSRLASHGVAISMDGRGRYRLDRSSTQHLRAVSKLRWFANTLLVFRRTPIPSGNAVRVCDRL